MNFLQPYRAKFGLGELVIVGGQRGVISAYSMVLRDMPAGEQFSYTVRLTDGQTITALERDVSADAPPKRNANLSYGDRVRIESGRVDRAGYDAAELIDGVHYATNDDPLCAPVFAGDATPADVEPVVIGALYVRHAALAWQMIAGGDYAPVGAMIPAGAVVRLIQRWSLGLKTGGSLELVRVKLAGKEINLVAEVVSSSPVDVPPVVGLLPMWTKSRLEIVVVDEPLRGARIVARLRRVEERARAKVVQTPPVIALGGRVTLPSVTTMRAVSPRQSVPAQLPLFG